VSDQIVVKICGITSEADGLLAVSLGAGAVGFLFAPSPRQITVQLAGDIAKRLPTEIITVGVFRDEAPQRVVEAMQTAGLAAAQLSGHESPQETQWIRARVPLVIKAFPAGDRTIARFAEFGADYLMVDGENPGSGQVFDWRLAEGVVDNHRLVLAGGLNPDNVADAVAHLRPAWVDVSTGVESSPGRKDPLRIRDFIAAARRADVEARARQGAGSDEAAGEPYDWRDG
jgi:phosphoribosylanthranilate isomerase